MASSILSITGLFFRLLLILCTFHFISRVIDFLRRNNRFCFALVISPSLSSDSSMSIDYIRTILMLLSCILTEYYYIFYFHSHIMKTTLFTQDRFKFSQRDVCFVGMRRVNVQRAGPEASPEVACASLSYAPNVMEAKA